MSILSGRVKTMIQKFLNHAGLEYVGSEKMPRHSLLGIRNLPIKTILDVGANRGQFAQLISNVFPAAKLICFEPLPAAFEELKAWTKMKRKLDVELFNIAIGDSEGEVEMCCHLDHSASSSILHTTDVCESLYPVTQSQKKVMVPLTTLDVALAGHEVDLSEGVLIKLDVQGYEDKVISGGVETFKKAQAVILEVSLDSLYEGQAGFNDLVENLSKLGLFYAGNLDQKYAKDGHVVFFDAVFKRA